jgi:beta-glucosidase/6-phospho-beta-glucosidase/beta-galactosidase
MSRKSTPEQLPLLDGVRFGVATSAFQIEGGLNGPDEPASNWV